MTSRLCRSWLWSGVLLLGLGSLPASAQGGPGGTLTEVLPGGAVMEFAPIGPGEFTMGDAAPAQQAHRVVLSQGCYIGLHEVTQAQWQAVMGTSPWLGQPWSPTAAESPATYVSWLDAQQFVHRLNQAAGDSLYRLPTEAEWEYACRAGTSTRWSFGDDAGPLGYYAWYAANAWSAGSGGPRAVGTRLANPWGLYDMHGNVDEWVQDYYRAYRIDQLATDPQGAATGFMRVIRGGSFATTNDVVPTGVTESASFIFGDGSAARAAAGTGAVDLALGGIGNDGIPIGITESASFIFRNTGHDSVPGGVTGAASFLTEALHRLLPGGAAAADTALVWSAHATESAHRNWGWGSSFHVGFRVVRLAAPAPLAWSVGVSVSDTGAVTDLRLGLGYAATDSVDSWLGETEQPPAPPLAAFDARWVLPGAGAIGVENDYRNAAAGSQGATWLLRVQRRDPGPPVLVAWDQSSLPPAGTVRLQDAATGGQTTDLDMRVYGGCLITAPGLTLLQINYSPFAGGHEYVLPSRWSMVSLPCAAPDPTLSALFPTALSLFGYDNGYQTHSALMPGVGYWLNVPSPTRATVRGPAFPDSVLVRALAAHWSMVGPGPLPLDVLGLKAAYPGLVSVFGFADGYYQTATMEPGRAYWVNVSSPCRIDLSGRVAPAGPRKPAAPVAAADAVPVLWAEGGDARQAIELGVAGEQVVALPPVPPTGLFDARVELGEGLGSLQVPDREGTYPVRMQGGIERLRWQAPAPGWELQVGETIVPLAGSGQVEVTAVDQILLRHNGLPRSTVLLPSFPNPFNPSAAIRYQLALPVDVRLRVYSATGQVVREWSVPQQQPGEYTVVWDGRDAAGKAAANGVYVCEMRAGDYRGVRRMLMLK